jgi:hypothetical protein
MSARRRDVTPVWINPKFRFDIPKAVLHHTTKHPLVAFKLLGVIRARRESVLEEIGWTSSNCVEAARGSSEGADLDTSF